MSDHVRGKSIIVTGAAGGFGRLISQKAAARGAKVLCADINESGLEETVNLITQAGGAASYATADVTDLAAMEAVAAKALAEHGVIDVMVNNAGVMPLAFYTDHKAAAAAWSRCIDINIKGVLNGMLAVHDQMIAQGRGHIVNLSSIYGNYPVAGAGVYGATKAAVNFLSESLRVESQGKIKVTIVKPTGVPTTNLASGIVNQEATIGIFGQNAAAYVETLTQMFEGKGDASQLDPDNVAYAALDPQYIADAVITAIDQPWGVSLGDITVRATGDRYIL